MSNYIKTFKQIKESSSNYKEIEFVCHNSMYSDSTNKDSQKSLYTDLKELAEKSDYKIKPYMQDFSDESHKEISLAVIILDKENEKYWEDKILKLAKKHGVDFDLCNVRTGSQVDSIIRGDYFDNII